MTTFNSQKKEATNLIMDELDKKITTINSYLVDGRVELDRLGTQKKNLEDEIKKLQDEGVVLKSETTDLEGRVGIFEIQKKGLEEKITSLRNELLLENTKLEDARKQV